MEYDIEPGLGGALVPTMMLQPLVENVVKYGVSELIGRAHIVIGAYATGHTLNLQVADNGPGFKHDTLKSARDALDFPTQRRACATYTERVAPSTAPPRVVADGMVYVSSGDYRGIRGNVFRAFGVD